MTYNILDIEKSIHQTIEEVLERKILDLDNNTRFEDLSLLEDSLSTVIFFSTLEDKLKKNIGDEVFLEIEKLDNTMEIKTIADLIQTLLKIITS